MRIGVPTEIKDNEYRVGLIPASVREYVSRGHQVRIQKGAGEGSGISDAEYHDSGAQILDNPRDIWENSDMIVKVKEPLPSEYDLMQPNQILYTYLHLAAVPELAQVLLEKKVSAVAYETIELADGRLPLLEPMSEVAGRMSIQVGARSLERSAGGKGVLLGGVPGVLRGKVVILGGGTVGTNAATMAVGMGADVTIFDVNLYRLRDLNEMFNNRIQTLYSNAENIAVAVRGADLVVGAVLLAGARAPNLVPRSLLKEMQPGSVVVDVAVDQGGCIETCKPTTHAHPTYVIDDIVHYCVANMPGAVPRTSTFALGNTTLRDGLAIAQRGIEVAVRSDSALAKGLNTYAGCVTHPAVAASLELEYTPALDAVGRP
ncbi:alanine dehydrogenase [Bradymonas sediminis]|uniref:Alanine dehydrogenase n=1 Tax=Bradymonas sediminis TaxID=1548548 RepID=A0A2Z4FKS5_9DELT|nr:alanine dehydrogenase [Bradymonas sediminis]AWV89405.1 alanine dehydrogenase [Bradymonas sediminis]TDP73587.1 alanine dehydrogenase [Bradymonas sediminis]